MLRRWILAVLAAAVMVVLGSEAALAGGGGRGGECYQDDRPTGEDVVYVLDSCFRDDNVTVRSGDVLTFEHRGNVPHTVTFTGDVDSDMLYEGESFRMRFREPGTYQYVCRLHPGMNGIVEVKGASMGGGGAFEVVSDGGAGTIADAAPASALSPQERVLRIGIDPASAALLVLVGLSFGAGAAGVARLARR